MATRLNQDAQEKRDYLMALESLRGVLDIEIAMRHGVSRPTVGRALKRWRENHAPLSEGDAIEEVRLHIARLYAAVDELAEMRGDGVPTEVAISAIKAQMQILKDIWELERAVGLLPDVSSRQSRAHFARDLWAWLRFRLEQEQGWPHDGMQFLHLLIEDWLANANKKDPPPLDPRQLRIQRGGPESPCALLGSGRQHQL